MTEPFFVDSNVLVYRHDRDEPEKQARAQALLEALWRLRLGRVSTQVLSEFYVVATRKLKTPVPRPIARDEVRSLHAWKPIPLDRAIRERAWAIEDRFGISWWDATVVAAAEQGGCRTILSEDLQDGQDLGSVRIVDPFRIGLAELGLQD